MGEVITVKATCPKCGETRTGRGERIARDDEHAKYLVCVCGEWVDVSDQLRGPA